MRNIFIITILLSPFSSPSWSETLTLEDLVLRNNLYYNKFTGVPFTGEIFGLENGRFKNGELEGFWKYYYKDGQLRNKGNYKDGKKDGLWETYYEDGKLSSNRNYKNGKKDGLWETYYENGQLKTKGNYKDGIREVPMEHYDEDGKLLFKNDTNDEK